MYLQKSTSRYYTLLALTFLVLSVGSATAEVSGDECFRVNLTTRLQWPTSGVWTTEAGQPAILVVDTLRNDFAGEVLRISLDGAVTAAYGAESGLGFKSRDGRSRAPYTPTLLRRNSEGGAVLLDQGSVFRDESMPPRVSFLDDRATLRRTFDLNSSLHDLGSKTSTGQSTLIVGTYNLVPMGQGILAFCDVVVTTEGEEPENASAFIYFEADGSSQILERIPWTADVINSYARAGSYLAAIGDVAYILRLDPRPTLAEVRVGGEIHNLPDFPFDFQSRPRLVRQQTMSGPRQATAFYRIMENSRMAVGLYAWAGKLYLLGKDAMDEAGQTVWWLVEVDRETGGEVPGARVRLPTQAASLIVVPGEFWVFLEQQPVRGLGELHAPWRPTSSMVMVPASWVAVPEAGQLDAVESTSCVALNQ